MLMVLTGIKMAAVSKFDALNGQPSLTKLYAVEIASIDPDSRTASA